MALVVSCIASGFAALTAQALRQAACCDLVELRLDRVGHPGRAALDHFMAECPRPVIVTVHGPETGGEFTGSREERLELLRDAARAGAAFVDVDWRDSLELGEVRHLGGRAGKCHRIVSRHEPLRAAAGSDRSGGDGSGSDEPRGAGSQGSGGPATHMASDADLLRRCLAEMEEVLHEGDALKFVPEAATTEDGLRVLRLLRERGGGLISFASGDAGAFTRVLAPIFGSPFTYAAPSAWPCAPVPGKPAPELAAPGLAASEATAPGQLSADQLLGLWPPGGPTPGTAIYGILGQPLAHSLSPFVQGMALKAAHLDALYLAFECGDLPAFLELADDENFRGFSVTAPHKAAALAAAVSSDEASRAAGAANTLVREGSGWRAENTDIAAIAETLSEASARAELPLAGQPGLVIGAGGAARAACLALKGAGVSVTVAARRAAEAESLADELGCRGELFTPELARAATVIVHATPVGTTTAGTTTAGTTPAGTTLAGTTPAGTTPVGQAPIGKARDGKALVGKAPADTALVGRAPVGTVPVGAGLRSETDPATSTDASPAAGAEPATEPGAEPSLLSSEHISPGTLVFDAVYSPPDTELLRAAARAGAVPIGGGGWFLRQAARQFQLFTTQAADEKLMAAAFKGALAKAAAPAASAECAASGGRLPPKRSGT